MHDAIVQFAATIRAAGLTPPHNIKADGVLHRFPSNGKPSDDSGYYVLHADDIPAGMFGCWRLGIKESWRADIGRSFTAKEEAEHRAKVKAMQQQRKEEEAKRHSEEATKAAQMWNAATPVPEDHPYLISKGIKPYGLRQYNGALVIPMYDADGRLCSLQFIDGDGNKRFLPGGKIKCRFHLIGSIEGVPVLCIAEGFATGATIHAVTGYPVIVAFNAGNLDTVAKATRSMFPDIPLIICADDDFKTVGNPGITKAKAAALAVGGIVAVPAFNTARGEKDSDFNDMARVNGLASVAEIVKSALTKNADVDRSPVTPVLPVLPPTEAPFSTVTPAQAQVLTVLPEPDFASGIEPYKPEQNTVASESKTKRGNTLFPGSSKRPCYRVYDDWCGPDSQHPSGVYHHSMSKETKNEPSMPVDIRLCGPLRVIAIARNKHGREFGQVIEFINKDGTPKRWNMPSRLLAGRGDEIQIELLDAGLDINYSMRGKIAEYINNQHPKSKVWTASTCGWFDNEVFVLPNCVIGNNADGVVYQCENYGAMDSYEQSGYLSQWQDNVARYCIGNSLLLLAVSQAFSGALLNKCVVDGIGVHIFGGSSKGKTSGMLLAGSVWGNPKRYNRSWTATANGLEAAATGVNDGLLCLDEMSKADAGEVSKCLYMLANGIGKQRSNPTGSARTLNSWRISVLSNGEESIEAHLIKSGIVAKPGELVRFLQLPIFGEYGAFSELHGMESGRAFSVLLASNSAKYYGVAGVAYLEKLTRDKRDFSKLLEQFFAIFEKQHGTLSPQEGRAARAFALIGLAGELATEYGITGWPERAAIDAALLCFQKWRDHRGHGELEPQQLVNALRQYIELYGDARFTSTVDETRLNGERSGHWRVVNGVKQWLFSSAGFKKAIGNTDTQQAIRLLIAQGVLIPGPKKNVTQVKQGNVTGWFYVIRFEESDNAG
ncbi:MAG: DUF927 domain-containing protein [Methylobacter sp.]